MRPLPEAPFTYQMLIGGARVESAGGRRYTNLSPAHGVPVGEYPLGTAEDVDAAVAAARRAFDEGPWPRVPGAARAKALLAVARLIEEHADELAYVEVLESGKPISQARDEIKSAAELWTYAAAIARHIHGDAYSNLNESILGLTLREPVGVVAAITPWNFPFLIASQKLPFALAAGCTVVIKPSELTPGTTLYLGRLLQQAGIPHGVVNIVTGDGVPVGARLAAHGDVDMISFTGSTEVGREIVRLAAGNLKRVSLELGGKNPQIVFPDADLDAALDAVVFGVYFNMGECCNSGSRLLVHREIAGEFTRRIVERTRQVKVGDPLDESTKVGAIISDEQCSKILRYIEAGKQEGALLRLGGNPIPAARGRFIEPTVFSDVRPSMSIAREEIFGPVLSVIAFDTLDEAIDIANGTMYGLSAGVWTRSTDIALTTARRIRAGTVWVNTFMDGFPELPFGGYKMSGWGRELGRDAIHEFTEVKTVQLHTGERANWWLPYPSRL